MGSSQRWKEKSGLLFRNSWIQHRERESVCVWEGVFYQEWCICAYVGRGPCWGSKYIRTLLGAVNTQNWSKRSVHCRRSECQRTAQKESVFSNLSIDNTSAKPISLKRRPRLTNVRSTQNFLIPFETKWNRKHKSILSQRQIRHH